MLRHDMTSRRSRRKPLNEMSSRHLRRLKRKNMSVSKSAAEMCSLRFNESTNRRDALPISSSDNSSVSSTSQNTCDIKAGTTSTNVKCESSIPIALSDSDMSISHDQTLGLEHQGSYSLSEEVHDGSELEQINNECKQASVHAQLGDGCSDCHEDFDNSSHRSENETESNNNIGSKIASWAVQRGITHVALRDLLGILREHPCHSSLPADPRTLLKTPQVTFVRSMPPGEFGYIGIAVGLKQLLESVKCQKLRSEKILKLMMNVDGVPISKSSNSVLWPILCSVTGYSNVFMVACYHGYEKPKDANDFMSEFVQEMSGLILNGFDFCGNHYEVVLQSIICDAPAKSFILNIKGHSGYFSCTKCVEEGDYVNHRMCFHELNALLRTDENFKSRVNEDHHCGQSALEDLPNFGLVSNVPLDYMHLVLLGVVRKLLTTWLTGDLRVRLSKRVSDGIDSSLQKVASFIPCEFQRKPDSFHHAGSWKATVCRLFLLYLGPIVLYGVLPDEMYTNFMSLHVAISILSSPNHANQYTQYADELLRYFVETFKMIYGKHLISHNVHGLIHLAKDVERFGPLDSFSAFKFENFNQFLKKQKRKSEKPLQQILRRAAEYQSIVRQDMESECDQSIIHLKPGNCGLLIDGCQNPQYRAAVLKDFTVSVSVADSCCGLDDGTIVIIKAIAHSVATNEVVIIGNRLENLEPLFTVPCSSLLLGSFRSSGLRNEHEFWPLSSVKVKYLKVPFSLNSLALMPLLHVSL